MSTFTDGPAPSVTPGPDAKPSKPRADPAGADRASADRGAVDESAGAQSSGSVWLHEEIQRRIAAERLGLAVEEVPGGHLAALSCPVELAERLVALLG